MNTIKGRVIVLGDDVDTDQILPGYAMAEPMDQLGNFAMAGLAGLDFKSVFQPGDIIVVSNDEDQTSSLMGEIMFTYAKYQRKLGGLVLDGPVRDVDALREMDLPVYATGSTPGGPHKEGPGEINVPIACGGISVHPGDIIVADADGIIVIPLKDAPAVLEAARKFHEQDAAKVEAAKNGTSNRAWVKKTLEAKNTEFIDGTYI